MREPVTLSRRADRPAERAGPLDPMEAPARVTVVVEYPGGDTVRWELGGPLHRSTFVVDEVEEMTVPLWDDDRVRARPDEYLEFRFGPSDRWTVTATPHPTVTVPPAAGHQT